MNNLSDTQRASDASSCLALFDWDGDLSIEAWLEIAQEFFLEAVQSVPNYAYARNAAGRIKPIKLAKLQTNIATSVMPDTVALYLSDSAVDPPRFWTATATLSAKISGRKETTFAHRNSAMSIGKSSLLEELTSSLCKKCRLNYGFGFKSSGSDDPTYHATGMSYGDLTDEEKRHNSYWFAERLCMRGEAEPKNRHLHGYLRDLYPLNIVTSQHLKRIVNNCPLMENIEQQAFLGTLKPVCNDAFQWSIPISDLATARLWAQNAGLLISRPPS